MSHPTRTPPHKLTPSSQYWSHAPAAPAPTTFCVQRRLLVATDVGAATSRLKIDRRERGNAPLTTTVLILYTSLHLGLHTGPASRRHCLPCPSGSDYTTTVPYWDINHSTASYTLTGLRCSLTHTRFFLCNAGFFSRRLCLSSFLYIYIHPTVLCWG